MLVLDETAGAGKGNCGEEGAEPIFQVAVSPVLRLYSRDKFTGLTRGQVGYLLAASMSSFRVALMKMGVCMLSPCVVAAVPPANRCTT